MVISAFRFRMRMIVNLAIVAAVLAALYRITMRSSSPPAQRTTWTYKALRGYFSHDDDPASWEFRAVSVTINL